MSKDGMYAVYLNREHATVTVVCDLTSKGGGWTVRMFQSLYQCFSTGAHHRGARANKVT